MKLIVAVEQDKKKTIKYKKEDLLNSSIIELLEEKGVKGVHPDDIEIKDDKIIVNTGSIQVLEIEDSEIINKSLSTVVKEKLKLKTTRGLKISIKSCTGK